MEKPIIFSSEEIRAILAGRKTQTRRVVDTKKYPCFKWHLTQKGTPLGNVGDRLWVRETWAYSYRPISPLIIYKADYGKGEKVKWKSSIHMPREASRIILEITGVRIERLQGISEQDAIAEGIASAKLPNEDTFASRWKDYSAKFIKTGFCCPIKSFASLWDSTNKKQPWNSNPWVWVIEFKVTQSSSLD